MATVRIMHKGVEVYIDDDDQGIDHIKGVARELLEVAHRYDPRTKAREAAEFLRITSDVEVTK